MKFIFSLDQGTTSSRAILFDHEGKVVTSAQKEFTQIFPQPGWVEHNPNEIWSSQSGVAAEAIKGERHSTRDITAIGITNQWETTIIWDRKTGEPVYNAIVWQDRRTAGICTKMKADGLSRTFQKKTGLLIDPYFAGTKVKWILNNVDGVRTRAEKGELAFGTVDSWLVWQLTNGRVHVTDESNAARTLLYNIHTGEWDKDLSEILGVQWHRIRWTCPVLVHKSSGQPGMRWHERWKMSCPGVPDPSCSARRRRWRPHRRWPSYWRRNLVTILRGKRGRSPMAIFLSEPP